MVNYNNGSFPTDNLCYIIIMVHYNNGSFPTVFIRKLTQHL